MDMFGDIDVARTVVNCVAPFAAAYKAWPVGAADAEPREGPLPVRAVEQRALIKELFEWAQSQHRAALGLLLYKDGTVVLDQHDGGVASTLRLLASEFENARQCWATQGVPADFFFLEAEMRRGEGTLVVHGRTVRMEKMYSPRQWALRQAEETALSTPSEAERLQYFSEACKVFREVLEVRRLELREPGKEIDAEGLREIEALDYVVVLIRARALGASAPQFSDRLRAIIDAIESAGGEHTDPTRSVPDRH